MRYAVFSFALSILAACADVDEGGELDISDGERFYADAFRLPSPIPLPEDARAALEVEVRLFLPKASQLTLARGPSGTPWLRLPEGARIDRVERFSTRRGGARIADVRGAVVEAGGTRRFHILRPERAGAPSLFGFSFPADVPEALANAHEAMANEMRRGRGFAWRMAHDQRERAITRYHALSSCNACHAPNKSAPVWADAALAPGVPDVHRETDGAGFYALLALFRDEGPLEDHRPVHPALAHPFISVSCPEGAALDPVRARCSDGSVAQARLDVAAALAAGDRHAKSVCRARRALWPRLSDEARQVFAPSLVSCGRA